MRVSRNQALLSQIGEFQLIQSIARGFFSHSPSPPLGIGDDAAIVSSPSSSQVVATDLLIEDVHFSRRTASLYDIGYKAAVANLSDIAAMGATPAYILVAVALPSDLRYHDWKELYRGIATPCKAHEVELVGGDTSASPTSLFLAITILGQVHPQKALTRSGANVGDVIYVSGSLGNSAAGLAVLTRHVSRRNRSPLRQSENFLTTRHLRPTPRIALGQLLSAHRFASAALDLSDGLSGDLSHLCRQSRVGALIHETALPLSPQMRMYASRTDRDPYLWALHGGEEYELLFTVPPGKQRRLEQAVKLLQVPVTAIGVITPRRRGLRITDRHASVQTLSPQSFTHFSQ